MTADSRHRGVYGAPLTPIQDDLTVDLDKLVAHCRTLLDAGCHGLMPLGSTGEGHSFTVPERIAIMDALAESGLPMERMLIGTSALAYPDTIRLARHATALGAGGVCVQPPFYYKPAEAEGLFDFFSRVIDGIADESLRLYVYDWEATLGVHHGLDFFARLFDAYPKQAVGIKDGSGDVTMLEARCHAFPEKQVFTRSDAMTLACLRAGGAGVISGLANIVPRVAIRLFDEHGTDRGDAAQTRIHDICSAIGDLPWVMALKAVMARLSGDPTWRNARPAFRRLTASEERRLFANLAAIDVAAPAMAAE